MNNTSIEDIEKSCDRLQAAFGAFASAALDGKAMIAAFLVELRSAECPHGYGFDTCTQCHDAFHAGKTEEREACAKLALTAAIEAATNGVIHCDQIGRAVAKAIRARGVLPSSRQGHPRALIRDEQDLDEVLEEIETILDSEPGTPEYERLQALSLLVEKFEEDKFPEYRRQ